MLPRKKSDKIRQESASDPCDPEAAKKEPRYQGSATRLHDKKAPSANAQAKIPLGDNPKHLRRGSSIGQHGRFCDDGSRG